jgi:hypothetical protein
MNDKQRRAHLQGDDDRSGTTIPVARVHGVLVERPVVTVDARPRRTSLSLSVS